MEDAEYAALLPSAPWLEGSLGEMDREWLVCSAFSPESTQPQSGAAAPQQQQRCFDASHETSVDRNKGRDCLATPPVVTDYGFSGQIVSRGSTSLSSESGGGDSGVVATAIRARVAFCGPRIPPADLRRGPGKAFRLRLRGNTLWRRYASLSEPPS